MIGFRGLCTASALGAVLSVAADAMGDSNFRPLNHLPGASSGIANAVSTDGAYVAGHSGNQAVRWQVSSNTPQPLGFLAGTTISAAHGISADGSVVVGFSRGEWDTSRSFRWTAAGMTDLNTFNAGFYSCAHATSADGSTIVGNAFDGSSDTVAYKANGTAATQALPGATLPAAFTGGFTDGFGARAISADGAVIVGNEGVAGPFPFRWESGTTTRLAFLDEMSIYGSANAVSADGTVAVGVSGGQAVMWSGTQAPLALGALPGASESEALAISRDGSVVVGTSGGHAFIWTETQGIQDLREHLLSTGATGLQDWVLTSATGISADGVHIVGYGQNPAGQTQAWIATRLSEPAACYANCDGSTVEPVLNIDDFLCFIGEFAAAQSLPHPQQITHRANCDRSTQAPVLNVEDFHCFVNAFAEGCR